MVTQVSASLLNYSNAIFSYQRLKHDSIGLTGWGRHQEEDNRSNLHDYSCLFVLISLSMKRVDWLVGERALIFMTKARIIDMQIMLSSLVLNVTSVSLHNQTEFFGGMYLRFLVHAECSTVLFLCQDPCTNDVSVSQSKTSCWNLLVGYAMELVVSSCP